MSWRLRPLAAIVLLLAIAGVASNSRLDSGRFRDRDPTQYFVYGYNLAHHGVFSLDRSDQPSLRPDGIRGPAYSAVLSLAFRLFDEPEGADLACYLEARAACKAHERTLRRASQLLYLGLIALCFGVALELTASTLAASGAALWIGLWFFPNSAQYATESLSALLLLLHARSLHHLMDSQRRAGLNAAIGGLSAGALTLSMSAAVFWIYLLCAAPVLAWAWRRRGGSTPSPHALVVMASLAMLICGGWMTRNLLQVGQFSISERSGAVLAVRAELSSMSWSEYAAAWHVFSPLGSELTTERDLSHVPNAARFSRRNPDGFYRRVRYLFLPLYFPESARKEEARLRLDAARPKGAVASRLEGVVPLTDAAIKRAAFSVMVDNWPMHLALVPPLTMRGLRLQAPILILVLLMIRRRRSVQMLAFLLPALYSAGIHAAVTHNITRYSDPLWPLSAIGLAWAICEAVRAWRTTQAENSPA